MLLRICSAAIVASFILAGSAQAQVPQAQVAQTQISPAQVSQIPIPQTKLQQIQLRSLFKLPDPRGEFVRLCAPICWDAGRTLKPFAVACMTMRLPRLRTTTFAKRCCAASARPACRRSRPIGCRRRNNPRSAPPSPRSRSRRCNACSSRRTDRRVGCTLDTPTTSIVTVDPEVGP